MLSRGAGAQARELTRRALRRLQLGPAINPPFVFITNSTPGVVSTQENNLSPSQREKLQGLINVRWPC